MIYMYVNTGTLYWLGEKKFINSCVIFEWKKLTDRVVNGYVLVIPVTKECTNPIYLMQVAHEPLCSPLQRCSSFEQPEGN